MSSIKQKLNDIINQSFTHSKNPSKNDNSFMVNSEYRGKNTYTPMEKEHTRVSSRENGSQSKHNDNSSSVIHAPHSTVKRKTYSSTFTRTPKPPLSVKLNESSFFNTNTNSHFGKNGQEMSPSRSKIYINQLKHMSFKQRDIPKTRLTDMINEFSLSRRILVDDEDLLSSSIKANVRPGYRTYKKTSPFRNTAASKFQNHNRIVDEANRISNLIKPQRETFKRLNKQPDFKSVNLSMNSKEYLSKSPTQRITSSDMSPFKFNYKGVIHSSKSRVPKTQSSSSALYDENRYETSDTEYYRKTPEIFVNPYTPLIEKYKIGNSHFSNVKRPGTALETKWKEKANDTVDGYILDLLLPSSKDSFYTESRILKSSLSSLKKAKMLNSIDLS